MTQSFDIEQSLTPLRRAMTVRHVVRWTIAGTGIGAFVAVLALGGLRVRGGGPTIEAWLCLAAPIAAGLLALARRPSLRDAARRADAHFRLHDRLTTALEFQGSDEPLVLLQRRQTAEAVSGTVLRSAAGAWVVRREAAAAILALLVASALVVVPAPSASHASPAGSAELARIRHLASEEIPALARALPQNNGAALKQAHNVLAHLQAQLRKARTKAQALRAISIAEQRLARITAGLRPVDQPSAATLARALGNYIPEHRGPANLQAAKALSSVARNLTHAGSSQRARIARDLLKAANAMHDARTRSLLRKAASAVGYGDKRRAQAALRKAARRLQSSSTVHKAQSKLSNTQRGLESAKYNLTPSHNGKLQGAALGNEKSKYSHEKANSAAPTGQNVGNKRIINRNSAASGLNGKRNLSESGQPSDSGGYSVGKQQDAAGSAAPKRFGVVYLQGKLSAGSYNTQIGPSGQVRRMSQAEYQRYINRYARSAENAVSRSSLPPSLQNYVRRYFVVLSHP